MKIKILSVIMLLALSGCSDKKEEEALITPYVITCLVENHIVTSCSRETYIGVTDVDYFIEEVTDYIKENN